MSPKKYGFNTQALHGGYREDPATGAKAVPIYQTTSFSFRDTEHAAHLFSLEEEGHIYSRISNPTVEVLEKRLASLENGVGAIAFSSGQASIATALMTILRSGDEFISSSSIYGGTHSLFQHSLARQGIKARFAKSLAIDDFEKELSERTRALYVETMGNPRLDIPDLESLAAWGRERKIPLIVDNTFASPYLCRPIEHGAAIVVHSLTKYIGGHGTSIGGALIDSGSFPWDTFPELTEPDPAYHGLLFEDKFGASAYVMRARLQILRDYGNCLSPFNAFLFLQGLETLGLRMERHSKSSLEVAKFLEDHPNVHWVSYPFLESHRDYELAKKYLPKGCGGMLAFGVRGGLDEGRRFIENLELFSHLANVGDAKSLAIHAASTTHQQLSPKEREKAGVFDDLIRLSIGLEDVEDLLADLNQALSKIY